MMKKAFTIIMILVLSCVILIAFAGKVNAKYSPFSKRHGEITVRNDSNKELYISISGRNQGAVGANQSESFEVRFGNHRVEAEWDGGSIHKYVSISSSCPRATWCIGQSDVE